MRNVTGNCGHGCHTDWASMRSWRMGLSRRAPWRRRGEARKVSACAQRSHKRLAAPTRLRSRRATAWHFGRKLYGSSAKWRLGKANGKGPAEASDQSCFDALGRVGSPCVAFVLYFFSIISGCFHTGALPHGGVCTRALMGRGRRGFGQVCRYLSLFVDIFLIKLCVDCRAKNGVNFVQARLVNGSRSG
jgi:hypothetical protein